MIEPKATNPTIDETKSTFTENSSAGSHDMEKGSQESLPFFNDQKLY